MKTLVLAVLFLMLAASAAEACGPFARLRGRVGARRANACSSAANACASARWYPGRLFGR
jgi:hypothetical protein